MSADPLPKILMIFDSPSIRETVSIVDLDDSFEIIELDDPSQAVDVLEDESPALALLCAMTRKTSSFETCQAIKEASRGGFLPVVIYSLHDDLAARKMAFEAGADAFMQLTISTEHLLYRLKSLLRVQGVVTEAFQRSRSLARASAEAADMILQLEEAHRRIEEQNRELTERDARISAQQAEIEQHLATLTKELELASTVQINLLPSGKGSLPGLSVMDRYVPATELGGDYFDYIPCENGIHICIADVTGHGVAPALVSVQARTVVRTLVEGGLDPAAVLTEANRFVFDTFQREFFLTMFCLQYDQATHTITHSGAGHNPLVLLRGNGDPVEEIYSTGVPLGVTGRATYENASFTLESGDRLLMYTDGITEAARPNEEQFGVFRLIEELQDGATQPGDEVLEQLIETARTFSQQSSFYDDVTLVLLERPGEDG